MASGNLCFVFIFPTHVGHTNPSLPIARRLVELGHEVHYVCHDPLRLKIEATGAVFHSAVQCEPELYLGRGTNFFSMLTHIEEEFGLDPEKVVVALWQLQNVMIAKVLPGLLRLLGELKPDVIIACPVASPEGSAAAEAIGRPFVALNTFAGPGAMSTAVGVSLAAEKVTYQELDLLRRTFPANIAAVRQLKEEFGVRREAGLPFALGYLDSIGNAEFTLSTTLEDLEDPMSPDLKRDYAAAGATLVAVGPLLDHVQAVGACGILAKVKAARVTGRQVVLVSMGTVVTGDMLFWGWRGRPTGEDGQPRGLSGKELCQAAWSGAFDAFGASDAEEGALIVVAVGTQTDALDGLTPPANAICCPFLPQVDILRAGVDLFLTHGGQNSFTESLAHGTPVVVCPGFSDQITNSHKAIALGVGLKVDRPNPEGGQHVAAVAAAQYRRDVRSALLQVMAGRQFAAAANNCAERLSRAGGVNLAVDLVLQAAKRGDKSKAQVKSAATPMRQSPASFAGC